MAKFKDGSMKRYSRSSHPNLPVIAGGVPLFDSLLPYARHAVDEDDIQALIETLRSPFLTQGPHVDEFEKALSHQCQTPFAVAVNNGTSALHAAYLAAGISPGDEVITTPFTFAATANAVLYCGAVPVFVDIDPETWTIDPIDIAAKITSKTKAVVSVDFGGLPCHYEEIRALCRQHNITLIADACHSLGAEYKGTPVGTLADITVLSFHPAKHITTGEGGAILTSSPKLAHKLKLLRHHGIEKGTRPEEPWFHEMRELGNNWRITDFQCTLGMRQLKKLDAWVNRRRNIAKRYSEAFRHLPVSIQQSPPHALSSYHLFVISLDLSQFKTDRRGVFVALQRERLGVQVHYIPVHLHPFYRQRFGFQVGAFPVAEALYESVISLPLFPGMTDNGVESVILATERVIRYYQK